MDSENLRSHSSFLYSPCRDVSGLSFHSRHPHRGIERTRMWQEEKYGGKQREMLKRGGWSKKVKSLLFLCPAPVARPLPPTTQSCWLGTSWWRSTKAVFLCVDVCASTCLTAYVCLQNVCISASSSKISYHQKSCLRMINLFAVSTCALTPSLLYNKQKEMTMDISQSRKENQF